MKSLYGDFINNDAYFLSMCAGGHGFAKPLCNEIIFCNGYPKDDDKDKRLSARIKSISIINGKNTDLKTDKEVFDIEFKLIKDVKNDR